MTEIKCVILIALIFFANNTKSSDLEYLDAANTGEAIGMMQLVLIKIKVHQFMCNRYHSDFTEKLANSVENWSKLHEVAISNYTNLIEQVDSDELGRMNVLNKEYYENKIVSFNRMTQTEQKELCVNEIRYLDDNSEESIAPNMFKFLRGNK